MWGDDVIIQDGASSWTHIYTTLYLGTAFTRIVGTIRSNAKIMQQARKLVLVDEFDREYKGLQRPADAVAETDQSLL